MLGIIFTIFFFVMGLFEFIGRNHDQLGLSLFMISAIFYIGHSIWWSEQIRKDYISKILGGIAQGILNASNKSNTTNNKEEK